MKIDNFLDIKNLLAGGAGALIASLIASIITIIGAYYFTQKIERQKLLIQKKEEVLILIFNVLHSIANVSNYYHGNLTENYDDYTPKNFKDDLEKIEINLLHSAALIKGYIGKFQTFDQGYALLLGKEGFFEKRTEFTKNIRIQNKLFAPKPGAGGYSHDHGLEYHQKNKDTEYAKFIEIIHKAEQALWEASYELIDMIKIKSKKSKGSRAKLSLGYHEG